MPFRIRKTLGWRMAACAPPAGGASHSSSSEISGLTAGGWSWRSSSGTPPSRSNQTQAACTPGSRQIFLTWPTGGIWAVSSHTLITMAWWSMSIPTCFLLLWSSQNFSRAAPLALVYRCASHAQPTCDIFLSDVFFYLEGKLHDS